MYGHFGNIDVSLRIFGSINKQIDNVIETLNNVEAPAPPVESEKLGKLHK